MGLQGIIWSENRLNHRVPQSSMYWNMMSFYNLCKHSWQSQRTGYAGHPGTVIASLPSTTKSPGHWLSWEEVGNCLGEKLRKCKWNCQEKKKEQDRDLAKKALPAADQQNLDRMRSRLTTTPHARKPSGNLTKEATLRLVTTLGNCSLGFRNNNCFRTHSAHALHSLCNSFLTYRYRSLSHLIHIK